MTRFEPEKISYTWFQNFDHTFLSVVYVQTFEDFRIFSSADLFDNFVVILISEVRISGKKYPQLTSRFS